MLRLYDSLYSGNAWKVRILLNQLHIPVERVTLDLAKGETKTPAFLAKGRFARVPVLELEDGRTLVESAAILLYLAEGSALLPDDPYVRAEVTSWLSFEQADLLRALALPRFYHLRGIADQMTVKIADFQEFGYVGLARLAGHLERRDWLVADHYTIADLGVFPYVAMAPQGGYDLARFPSIRPWLERIKAQPGWVPLLEEAVP
jgi:glutathione S-transferase